MKRFACCLALVAALVSLAPFAMAADAKTVAVIGTGDMGDSVGPAFARLGYRVIYGSRNPDSEKVQALVRATGANAGSATAAEAAGQAGTVVLAVPWPAMETVAQNLGDLAGKIVIDVSMPFEQGVDGYPQHLLDRSSAELIQEWNPGARVVKAFATMGSHLIDDPAAESGPVSIPIASDDREAKEQVARIAAGFGLDPVDFGPLRMARAIETLQMVYMIPLTQNRPWNWEFYFRRSEHYGCYLSQGNTTEGLVPPHDAADLATFPGDEKWSVCR